MDEQVWQTKIAEILTDIKEWRRAHPTAAFVEIEDEVHRRMIVWIHGGDPMNEARQMHDHLVNAMLPIIPRTVYQDRRRLNTLVWAIVGLCLTHTVHVSAWAEVT